MKRSKLLIYALVSFIVCAAVVYELNGANNEKDAKSREAFSAMEKKTIDAVIDHWELALAISQQLFPYHLQDTEGNSVDFFERLDTGRVLVLRYSELNCNVCVDSALSYFKTFMKKAGEDHARIIVDYNNDSYLYQFLRVNQLTESIIYRSVSDSNRVEINTPYLFITDKSRRIYDVFVPMKELPEVSKKYYNTIFEKYFRM